MSDERNVGGANVEGDVKTGGGDFAGRDRVDVTVPVTINVPDWNPTVSHGQDRRRLTPETELEFRQTFARLTEALIELRESVKTNNALTKQQIDLLSMQVDNVKKIAEGAEHKVISTLSGVSIVSSSAQPLLPRWAILFGAFCLTLITVGVIAVVYFLAQGI